MNPAKNFAMDFLLITSLLAVFASGSFVKPPRFVGTSYNKISSLHADGASINPSISDRAYHGTPDWDRPQMQQPHRSRHHVTSVRRVDQELNLQPIDAFLRRCPDCFTHVDTAICPMNELALDMREWAHELGDLLSHGCGNKECADRCCPSPVAPVSVVVRQMTNMVKNTYHLIRQYCQGCTGPPTPYPDNMSWSSWHEFCTCDCVTGLELRDRKCLENGTVPVPVERCRGLPESSRDSRECDVRKTCPVCVTSCAGLRDGDYPACSSCSDYVSCRAGGSRRYHCKRGTEFDAFVRKCVVPPSPSCSLVEGPFSCTGLPDGKYPKPNDCSSYTQCTRETMTHHRCPVAMEYNHHSRRCEFDPSPTCVRSLFHGGTSRRGDVTHSDPRDWPVGDQPVGGAGDSYMQMETHHNHEASMAPSYMYYDQSHGLKPEERREMYALGVTEDEFKVIQATMTPEEKVKALREVEDEKEREYDELKEEEEEEEEEEDDEEDVLMADEGVKEVEGDEDEEEEEEEEEAPADEEDDAESVRQDVIEEIRKENKGKRRKSEGRSKSRRNQLTCISDCNGVAPGNHPACKGCRRYIICKQDGGMRRRKCARGSEFDMAAGECVEGQSESCVADE